MPFTELEPPITLPRNQISGSLEPSSRATGVCHIRSGSVASLAMPRGIWINGLRSRGPASISNTDIAGFSVSRDASTHPADPAPTIT